MNNWAQSVGAVVLAALMVTSLFATVPLAGTATADSVNGFDIDFEVLNVELDGNAVEGSHTWNLIGADRDAVSEIEFNYLEAGKTVSPSQRYNFVITNGTEGTDGQTVTDIRSDTYLHNFQTGSFNKIEDLKITVYNRAGTVMYERTLYDVGAGVDSSGGSISLDEADDVTTGNGTATESEFTAAITVDENVTVTGGPFERGIVSIDNGFDASVDRLNANTTVGIASVDYNETAGILTIEPDGENATAGEFEAAFRTVTYTNLGARPDTADREISFRLTTIASVETNAVYSPATGHYYEWVEQEGIGWEQARQGAITAGGHLVTIRTPAENAFLLDKVGKAGWVGASATDITDQQLREWRWVNETDGSAGGDHFFDQTAGHVAFTAPFADPPVGVPGGGEVVGDAYINWSPRHEPNNKFPRRGGQDYAYFCVGPGSCPDGMWKDGAANSPGFRPAGYIIEYADNPATDGGEQIEVFDSRTVSYVAGASEPVAAANANTLEIEPNESITFDASGSTNAAFYEWDLTGNGRPDLTGETNTTDSFNQAGNYRVTLTVTSVDGNTDTDTVEITVKNVNPPTVVISGPSEATRGEEIQFDGSNSTDGVAIGSFEWAFGDDSTSTAVAPIHGYTETGTYTVRLNVTDIAGNVGTETQTTTITDSDRPVIAGVVATQDGDSLTVAVDSDQLLDAVTVEILETDRITPRSDDSAALVTTLVTNGTQDDFGTPDTVGGNYTYSATTGEQLSAGNYTLRLVRAENTTTDDGGFGQETTIAFTEETDLLDDDGLTLALDDAELPVGGKTQLTVTGNYTNGTAVETDDLTLESADDTIANVTDTGTVTAVGEGTTTITASIGNTTESITIAVTEAVIDEDGLTVSVADAELSVGEKTQLTVSGTYTNGATVEIGNATLSSNDTAVATVAPDGTITAVGEGQAAITVVIRDEQETVTITVTEAVVDANGLTATLVEDELAVGQQTTLAVTGNFTDGTAVSFDDATLTTNTTGIINIDPNGTVTATGGGVALITATVGDVSAGVSVSVTEAQLIEDGLSITIEDDEIAEGRQTAVSVTAELTDGSQVTTTDAATLTTTDVAVATVAGNGTLTAVGVGNVAVEALFDGETATVDITVTDAEIVDGGLDISLATTTLADGESTIATVTATLSNGSTVTVTDGVSFDSTNGSVATVDGNGTVTAVGVGTTVIEAAYANENVTGSLTVGEASLVDGGLTIDATATELIAGGTDDLTVTAQYTNGSDIDVTDSAAFTSNETAVLTVDNGTITAVGEGRATLTTTFGGESDTVEVTVLPGQLVFETNASADSYLVDVGSTVTFRPGTVDETRLPGGNYSSQWQWEWNNGATIETTPQNTTTRSFTEPATVNVTYTLQSGGTELTDRFIVSVVDREDPEARLTAVETVTAGELIVFDGSGSTDNAVIADYEWSFGNGTTASGATLDQPTGRYETPGEYRVSLTVTDTSNNTETATATVLVTGAIASLDDDGIGFGDVGTNSTDTASIAVTNNGTSLLNVSAASINGPNATAFSVVTDVPFVVRPGETRPLAVSFAPTETGQLNASLDIATNSTGGAAFNLNLSGRGTASDLRPDAAVVSFGEVDVDDQTTAVVSVNNTGTADAALTRVGLRGSGTDQFRLAGDEPSTIEQGESGDLTVIFEPQSVGEHRVTLEIETAVGETAQVSIVGSGEGPVLSVPVDERGFGETGVGTSTTATVAVSNYGTQPLGLTNVSVTGSDAVTFSVETASSTIAAGQTGEIELGFEADQAGSYEAALELTSNDPTAGTTSVDLTATAVAAKVGVDRMTANFGETVVGSPEYLNITVRNQGSSIADLNIEGTRIVGTNPEDFSVESGDAPFTLAPGGEHDIQINFTALDVGKREAQLQVRSDAGNEPLISVWLSNTRSYILVNEISNPTVNVDGNNLVGGKDHVINVATPAMERSTVTLEDLRMTMRRDGDFDMNVVNSEDHADTEFVADDGTDILQYVQIDHLDHDSASTFDNTGLAYRVAIDAVAENVDPTAVKLHRYNTTLNEWETLDTAFVGQTDTHYRYEVETPGFSEFTVTAPKTSDEPTDSGSTDRSRGRSETVVVPTPQQEGDMGVTVTNPVAGSTVMIDGSTAETGGALSSVGNILVDRLHLGVETDRDFWLYISTYEDDLTPSYDAEDLTPETELQLQAAASAFTSQTATVSAGYVHVQHDLAPEELSTVTFEFRIRQSYLDELGGEVEAVSLYRQEGTEWRALPTEYVGLSEGHYRYESISPGFSVFALGTGVPTSAVTEVEADSLSVDERDSATVTTTVTNHGDEPRTETEELTASGEVFDARTVPVDSSLKIGLLLISLLLLLFVWRRRDKEEEEDNAQKY